MKRRHLEMLISSLLDVEEPRPDLEQYRTPSNIACDMLYEASMRGDIEGKKVMELGCGGAPFAIGAAALGASKVYAVDIDSGSIETAMKNIGLAEEKLGRIDIDLIQGDVSDRGLELPSVDTVLMNPPFGAQKKHADRPFIEAGIRSSEAVYSIHNGNSLDFLKKIAGSLDRSVELLFETRMDIPQRYHFHQRDKGIVNVILVLIRRMG